MDFVVEMQNPEIPSLTVCPLLLCLVRLGPRSRTASLVVASCGRGPLDNVVFLQRPEGPEAKAMNAVPAPWVRRLCLTPRTPLA